MKRRQEDILLAIIDHFIRTAVPVGSKTIVHQYQLGVSGATVRSEMHDLEEQGLICQPHTSAGRVPTEKGYRFFVESMKESKQEKALAKKDFVGVRNEYLKQKEVRELVYSSVDLIARVVENVSFATLPGNDRTIFLGLSNVLRQPEFVSSPGIASQVVEVLEHDFIEALKEVEVDEEVRIYIGRENMIEAFNSCSMIVTSYKHKEMEGVIGVLGPMRMRYNYNMEVLAQARNMLCKG
jgi:transcriptional regulator of heat shock response